jgi:hypothetical protein
LLSGASETAWTGRGDGAAPATRQMAGVHKPDDHTTIAFAFLYEVRATVH